MHTAENSGDIYSVTCCMEKQGLYEDILFVVVVYEKALEQVLAIRKISDFYATLHVTPSILVFDNSKISQTPPKVFHYLHNPENGGVSRAYNYAFDLAVGLKKKWMCLLDQDADVSETMLVEYFNSVCEFPNERVFAPKMISDGRILSPFKAFLGKGYSPRSVKSGRHLIKNYEIINSGLLIDVEMFGKAGGYDERYTLDLSDHVFWKRLSKVSSTFVVTEAMCEHHHSSSVDHPGLALDRFRMFLEANKQYSQEGNSMMTFVPVISRGLKLSWRFRNIGFLKLALKSFT